MRNKKIFFVLILALSFFTFRLKAEETNCKSDLKPDKFYILSEPELSEDLVLRLETSSKDISPASLKLASAFFYAKVEGYGGFLRPINHLVFSSIKEGIYEAKISLPIFADKNALWDYIYKAQKEWGLERIPVSIDIRLLDSKACQTETFSATSKIGIKGYTRNNMIPGQVPQIVSVMAPPVVSLNKSFVIEGTGMDADNDLGDQIKINGSLDVKWLPFSLNLPPNIYAVKKEQGKFVATITPKDLKFYEKWLRLLPADSIDAVITITIKDQAGHQSKPYKFNLTLSKQG